MTRFFAVFLMTQRQAARFDHSQELISQLAVAMLADHASQPQPRGDHDRHRHPGDHPMPFHPDLIGLHMLHIEFRLHHGRLMHALTMLPRSLLPPRYRAFIQSKGVDNGLAGTAIGKKRHDHNDEIFCLAQPLKHGSSMRTECLPTRFTFVSLTLLPMTYDVACPNFPSCRTLPGRAK